MSNQPRFEDGRASPVGPIGVPGRTFCVCLIAGGKTLSVEVVCPFSFVCPDRRAEGAQRVDACPLMETDPVPFACRLRVSVERCQCGKRAMSGLGFWFGPDILIPLATTSHGGIHKPLSEIAAADQ